MVSLKQVLDAVDAGDPEDVFVPACHYQPKTNGLHLGSTQREIVAFLGTAPAGLSGISWRRETRTLVSHGWPTMVALSWVTRAVYGGPPTGAQTRAVQRAVRRLEALGLVRCAHGWTGDQAQTYKTRLGFEGYLPVSGLFVALAEWKCDHEVFGVGGGRRFNDEEPRW